MLILLLVLVLPLLLVVLTLLSLALLDLRTCVAGGTGLGPAHAEGPVLHRDIKDDNRIDNVKPW